MNRYFIELAYKGTPFSGWQLQTNAPTVQGELERVLWTLFREPVRLTGAGRTDSGVHASHFVAHFDTQREDLDKDTTLIIKLNGMLPREIVVFRIIAVTPNAHARYDALSRTYHYRIATKKNPFTIDLAFHFYRSLDLEKMNEVAAILPQYNDFTSFAKLHGESKTNLCELMNAQWFDSNDELRFEITANRFLRNMVRAIVGTMIDVGLGKYPPEDVHRIIQEKDRNAAGASAPPQGLYLVKIEYPRLLIDNNLFIL